MRTHRYKSRGVILEGEPLDAETIGLMIKVPKCRERERE